jgi:Cd2+/Zn2+-exporting ATPase
MSNHPIAQSICRECAVYGFEDGEYAITEVRGKGVVAKDDVHRLLCGSAALLAEYGLSVDSQEVAGTRVYVAFDDNYLGYIDIEDRVKEDSVAAIARLSEQKMDILLLSGDAEACVAQVADEVKVGAYRAQMLPEQKVEAVQSLIAEGHKVAFVGDGINDAPVIATADVGVAMACIGSDAAIESADVVLMNDSLMQLPRLVRISRKTQRIVKENIIFAIVVKIGVMSASFTEFARSAAMMWLAVTADVGVALLAILNALRSSKDADSRSASN